jgi:hypothetical protein
VAEGVDHSRAKISLLCRESLFIRLDLALCGCELFIIVACFKADALAWFGIFMFFNKFI